MKILMVTDKMGLGGAETHILTLTRALLRRGHSVSVASSGGALEEELAKSGARTVRLPLDGRNPIEAAVCIIGLRRLAAEYDVVHCHARYPAMLCRWALGGRLPMVTTAHWVFENSPISRYMTEWGDAVLAVSPDIAAYLWREYRLSPHRVRLTVNGVEGSDPAFGSENGRRVIHVSRLDRGRSAAAAALIECAPTLAAALPGAEIIIVGNGDMYRALARRAAEVNRKIGYRCLRLVGGRRDIYSQLRCGDVFVGVSRAALEASACGLPVLLAGDEGYMSLLCRENFDGAAAGNFCARGGEALSPCRLASDLVWLLKCKNSAADAAEYCRERVAAEYSPRRMAIDAEGCYAEAIALRSKGKSAVLCGYFGGGNTGDELAADGLIEGLRRQGYGKIDMISASPRRSRREHGVGAIFKYDLLSIGAGLLYDHRPFCLAGGNLLQNETGNLSLAYYAALAVLAGLCGSPVFLLGGGIGDLRGRWAERVAAYVLKNCSMILPRSRLDALEAERLCGRTDSVRMPDPARLVKGEHETVEACLRLRGLPSVRFAIIAPSGGGDDSGERLRRLCRLSDEAARLYAEEGLTLLFLPLHEGEDLSAARLCQRICGVGRVVEGLSPHEIRLLCRRADAVLGDRLHSVVLATDGKGRVKLFGKSAKKLAFEREIKKDHRL